MTQYAQITTREANLKTDFGYSLAVKWFGQETVDSLPTYVRGKNKGKPKGRLAWKKVERGGWVRQPQIYDGEANGYVEHRVGQVIGKALFLDEWQTPIDQLELVKAEGENV